MSQRLRYLYRAYRYRYRVDPAEIRYLCERLRPGQTAVDVGCFKGAYTYWMRRCVWPTGSVIAFEPQPRQVAYLREVFAAMNWGNVTLEAMGVSDAPGRLRLLTPPSGHEATFVARTSGAQPCNVVEVPVTSLDAYFSGRPAGPDFLKIDVEGHESAVLEGRARRSPRAGRRFCWNARPATARTATCGRCSRFSSRSATRGASSSPAGVGRSRNSIRPGTRPTNRANSCRPATRTILRSSTRAAKNSASRRWISH